MKQKNRYFLAYYAMKPRKGAPTHLKGWMNNDRNVQWDERVMFREGLKKNDMIEAQVVLDLDDKKVMKNWKADDGEGGMDFNTLYEYYEKNYSRYIEDGMKASNKHRDTNIQTEEKVD